MTRRRTTLRSACCDGPPPIEFLSAVNRLDPSLRIRPAGHSILARALRAALRLLSLEWILPGALAGTIVAFAFGSSVLPRLVEIGSRLRWAGLGVLLAVALAQAATTRRSRVVLTGPAALALGFVILAVGSTLWSVAPGLTLHRAGSLAMLILAAAALAYAGGTDGAAAQRMLLGVLAAAAAVGLAGLFLIAVNSDDALTGQYQVAVLRFRGIGQQPNTDAMLYALALPISLWLAARGSTRRSRAAGVAAFLVLGALVVFSGSRGAQLGGVVGLVVVGATLRRVEQFVLAAALLAIAGAAVGVGIGQTRPVASAPAHAVAVAKPAASAEVPGYPSPGALGQELGHGAPSSYVRSIWHSSGRTEAWRWAIRHADSRPALGYGFGTEERVFEDHYLGYQGKLVSSSWIGLYLQLGAFGVALLLAIFVSLGAAAARALRRATRDPVAVTCAAVVAVAVPLTFTESWIYSVGNVATVPFWVVALLLGGLVWGRVASDGS
jgi:O-antigen ligase/polysaccharide polymerase Wzy-like membrane protein